MSRPRLHITVDPEVLDRARRYAERNNTSISRLVTEFLSGLPGEEEPREELTPTVRRLLGIARQGPDREGYRRHLVERYGS